MIDVRPLEAADEAVAATLLDTELGGRQQARLGEVHDVLEPPGLGVWDGERLVGVATYAIDGDRAELAALAVSSQHRLEGHGSRLIDAVIDVVAAAGVRELWLVTTNDNLNALRLYQRRGFRLTELHPGAIDRARELKPSIPEVGEYGIALRDELVLSRALLT